MKHCEGYALALSALLDGELSEREKAETLAHLESCEACRTYFAELTAMHDAIGDLDGIEVPEGFTDGVMNRLHEETRAQKTATPRKKWMGLAACAAVVVLVGAVMLPNFGGRSADTAAATTEAPMMAAAESAVEEEYGEESVSVQYNFAEAEEAPAELASGAAAPNGAALARVYACSEEAEQYLIEQGCEIYEQSDALCSYRAPIEVVRDMAALGLIDENDEALALDDIAEGSVEVVVRVTDTESAQNASESEGQPE